VSENVLTTGVQAEDEKARAERRIAALVVGRQPIARAGLRGLLEEIDDALVVGQATTVEQAAAIALDLRPDILLVGWETGQAEEIALLAETLGPAGIPVVLLGEAPSPAELNVLLRAGVRGFLLSDATSDDVGAAIDVVTRDFLVLDAVLSRALSTPGVPTPLLGDINPAEPLTEREQEVLQLLASGLPNKAIARRLNVTEHTVKFHVGSILAKLGASSRTEAVTRAARQGLLDL